MEIEEAEAKSGSKRVKKASSGRRLGRYPPKRRDDSAKRYSRENLGLCPSLVRGGIGGGRMHVEIEREEILFWPRQWVSAQRVVGQDRVGIRRRGMEEMRSEELTSCLASLAAQPAQLRFQCCCSGEQLARPVLLVSPCNGISTARLPPRSPSTVIAETLDKQ